jgi:hypothetical protein
MGTVLYQQGDDGDRRIVSCASAKFTPAESKYHSNEQKCLAVVWALKKYRPLLQDNRFILLTDNAALTWLDRVQDKQGNLTRWAMLLKRFSFDVEHVPGKKNELSDTLSRQSGDEVFVEDPADVVAKDTFSIWIEAFPIPKVTLGTIAPFLEREVFLRWGFPQKILTDNAPQFRDQHLASLCEGWGARPWTTPV